MYRMEEFKNRTTMKECIENYKNAAGFLDYCEKNIGCGQVWSCPLYDFDPEDYREKYEYFYLIGKKIYFDQNGSDDVKTGKEYISRVCIREKDRLTDQVRALEKKYPGSIGLSAGSCHMCRQCARPLDNGCRYSDEIRYFLESLGADLGKTAGELLGVDFQLMKQKSPECYTLINVLLTDDPKIEMETKSEFNVDKTRMR